ncbi:hypothetical protein [Fodinibius sp.]|uniref:hypothetical protein n=1 Tax=Fodinibius sp. TaxID=1872440 RepID=UPI002ACDED15|nr:hypothetical protein [Fodinibius sp.]MDZ7660453.1 hypothetical protein [Fodinibius sp.]
MSEQIPNTHQQLKFALGINRKSLKGFANTLKKPDGSIGISHTALIRVAQDTDKTPWIREIIESTINQSKDKHPSIWEEFYIENDSKKTTTNN